MPSLPLQAVLQDRRSQPHQLIEVLQDVQKILGYIPEDIMATVSTELGVPLIEVSRVAHFYKAFSLEPRGKHTITVCTGTACHVRASAAVLEEIESLLGIPAGRTSPDGLFTLERVNCLGACALGPIVVLDGQYHADMTPQKVRTLVQCVQASEKEVTAHA